MAEAATIARPYAQACFALARQGDTVAAWSDTLATIEAVARDPHIAARVRDPNIDPADLEAFILGALGEALDGHGRNFVQMLVQTRRLELAPQIRELYEESRREHESRVEA